MHRQHHSRTPRGLTLLECLVAITVLGILVSLAAPAWGHLVEQRVGDGLAQTFINDLAFLRTRAQALDQPLRLSINTSAAAAGACYVIHSGPAGSCRCQSDGQTSCTAGAQAFKVQGIPAQSPVQLQANVPSLLFDPEHSSFTLAATVRWVGASGAELHQVLNIMGRVRACSPGGQWSGVKAC